MVFLNTLRLYILFIIIVHTLASFRPYANFRQSPTIKEPKTKYKVSPTLKYHYNFGKTINLNPLKKLRRRREDDDSPIEGIAEDDHSSLAIPHDPSPPPLASLHPLVDSVALRLTRLLTGGTSRFVDTEFDVGEEAKSERVKAPVHIIDIKGQGKLPPIVLLHGITSCSADFAPLALELRSKFSRIIAIDLLGHGLTPLPNTLEKPHFSWMTKVVSQVLDKCLPDQKAIILGNSMGGLVAMRTALERPDIVDGLFLISPAGGPLNEKQIDSLTSIFHISSHEEGKEFIDRMHGQKPFTPLLHLMAWVARGRVNKDSVKQIFDSTNPKSFMTEKDCQQISVPTALFWGEDERVLPKDHLHFFRSNIPSISVCNPPFFGHVPQNDDWKFVAGRCAEFTKALHNEGESNETVESWVKPPSTTTTSGTTTKMSRAAEGSSSHHNK